MWIFIPFCKPKDLESSHTSVICRALLSFLTGAADFISCSVIFQSYRQLLFANVIHEYKDVITLCLRRLSMAVSMAELEKCMNCSEALPSYPTQDVWEGFSFIVVTWIKLAHVCIVLFFHSLSSQENQMMILAYFRVMYTVGYSLSLSSLSLALVILLIFRWVAALNKHKLLCQMRLIAINLTGLLNIYLTVDLKGHALLFSFLFSHNIKSIF